MLKSPAALTGVVGIFKRLKCTACLFPFEWINDLNDGGLFGSVNCGPRTAVAGVNVVGEYWSVPGLIFVCLSSRSQFSGSS